MDMYSPICVLICFAITVSSHGHPPPHKYPHEFLHAGQEPGPRIVGGYNASAGEFPYQVSVRSTTRVIYSGHFCGGAILNATTVVTAAHCLHNVPGAEIGNLYIVAGTDKLKNTGSDEGVQIFVKETLIHPDFGPVYSDYDIALLFLQKPLPLNQQNIAAVRLQEEEGLPAGTLCVASGWGRTEDSLIAILPNQLQGVKVPIVDFDTCSALYHQSNDYSPVIESQLCAGYEEGGKDACQGDSGGPLVCDGLLTGIVSWGNGCALHDFPGVYSDVAFLLSWIKEYVVLDGPYPAPSTPSPDGPPSSSSPDTTSTAKTSSAWRSVPTKYIVFLLGLLAAFVI